MQQFPRAMPDLDPIINSQSRTQRRRHQRPPIPTPLTVAGIRGINGGDLVQRPTVEYVDFAREVAEAAKCDEPALRVEGDVVPRVGAKVGYHADTLVEEDGFGGDV